MTLERLLALQDARAFDPVPPLHDLHDLHVPFDELTGGQLRFEARVDAALRRGERVAVIGGSGSGKTSLVEYVLRPTVEGLAPIPIPVALTDPATLASPALFAEHVVRLLRRYIERAIPAAAADVPAAADPARPKTRKFTVSPHWMGASVDLAYEMRTVADSGDTAADHVETVRAMLDLIASRDLTAVIVLDDTDKWIRGPTGDVDAERRDAFFRRIVRYVAEHLGCAAVVAVHPSYLNDPAYRSAQGFLSTSIAVPLLPGPQAWATLLEHRQRITEHTLGIPTDALAWSAAAPDALHHYYYTASDPNLRTTLYLAHASLSIACADQADQISEAHIELAARDIAPPRAGPWD